MKFRSGLVVAVATAILLASCGGGDSEGARGTEQPADAQQGTTAAELGPICENPPPTPMSLGTPVSGEVPGFDPGAIPSRCPPGPQGSPSSSRV